VLVLALDTSSPAVSAALVRVDEGVAAELVAESVVVDARRHGELLAQGVQEVLAGRPPQELDAVVVGTGPGPFTGLRVGLVSAAAMSDALAIPAYGVCSLDAVEAGRSRSEQSRGVVAVTDARRREVYWARYDAGARVAGPEVSRPADLADQLRVLSAAPVLVGAGALLHREVLGEWELVEDALHPSLLALVQRAADRVLAGAPADALTPLYLRRPDAVEPGAGKRVTA
jgi:tRNA threonylcarbamoyl adenosine modification protein YeaZ